MLPTPRTGLFVGASQRATSLSATVVNPWTSAHVAQVALADIAHANEAAAVAKAAFDAHRATPAHVRKRWLRGTAAALQAHAEAIAGTITAECGKPISLSRVEVRRAITTFEIAAEECGRNAGEVLALDAVEAGAGYTGQWRRVPRGPVLGITPFNFPLNLVAHKVAPALAAGASIVVKPAPQAPLSALWLRNLALASGVPSELFQVLPATLPAAEALVISSAFEVLSFTGSAKAGFLLKAKSGRKKVVLELGGNAAVVLHEDAVTDATLDDIVTRIVRGAFGYAGQTCIKVQRLFVHGPVVARVRRALQDRIRTMAPADPTDEGTLLGSMIDSANAERVEAWVAEGVAAGAKALVPLVRDGARVSPTLLDFEGVALGDQPLPIVDEEVFGPVLTLHPYDRWDEALGKVNASRYGLQAGIFTDSLARVQEAFDVLDVGGLVVGDVPTFRVDSMPYGGTKDSGLGREGVACAIEEMTEKKLLVLRR
jgi:acyl-CoA reductase-like NAD-dependent aldehyde dehydrogenase